MIQGAEAEIEILEDKVVKERPRKKYRHPELDQRIRKQRTQTEYNSMKKALRHDVSVPKIEQVSDYVLEIEKIDGKSLAENFKAEKMGEVGKHLGRLHSAEIVHGDMTTKNIMHSDKIYLIDFGLSGQSTRTEDRAVDLHLLKQVLKSSHSDKFEEAWENFMEGYRPEFREDVIQRLAEVEQRGRYK